MKNKIDFKTLFKKLRHSLKNIGSDADKDWKVMISIFFILFVYIVAFHINLFLTIKDRLAGNSLNVAPKSEHVDSEVLGSMVSKYRERAEEYAKVEQTNLDLIDPN